MRNLDLTTLRLFVAVCDHRNIGRAGQQERIGASAISKRLAQLEERLGAPLLERHRRGVVPTAAGDMLLEHARTMLATADRVARDMAAYRQGVKERIRILASVSVITETLPDDVAAFLQMPDHVQIRVDIEERTSAELVRALKEGLAPMGICWDAADTEGLQTRPYRSDALSVAVHRDHPLAKRESCDFAQTLAYEHVGLPENSAVHVMLARAAAILGKPIHYRANVTTFDASLRCVQAGLGLAIIPKEIMRLTDAWAKRRFAICYRSPAHLSPAAKLLLAHLSQRRERNAAIHGDMAR